MLWRQRCTSIGVSRVIHNFHIKHRGTSILIVIIFRPISNRLFVLRTVTGVVTVVYSHRTIQVKLLKERYSILFMRIRM